MSQSAIYLSPPLITDALEEELSAMLADGWLAPDGPPARAFEQALGAYLNIDPERVVCTHSGTAALHMALKASGVSEGDWVVSPSLTFVASVNPIGYLNAQPWFVDSEPTTLGMDPEKLSYTLDQLRKQGKPIGAVIAVHLFGQQCPIDRIREICQSYDVPLIEDAAEALGAQQEGIPVGTRGDYGILSFNGNKLISTAGGGAVICPTAEDRDRIHKWITQSKEPELWYEHQEVGYNYAMNGLAAAVGSPQVSEIEQRVQKKRTIYERYERLIDQVGLPVQMLPRDAQGTDSCWLSGILLDNRLEAGLRDRVVTGLAEKNIEARPLWKPMHLQPLYQNAPMTGSAVSEDLFQRGLCLPSGLQLKEKDQQRVIRTIAEIMEE
ncbi:MAG: DegT/DnrJ/EryC1/StrS family aminotransferase [Bacteroidota bacterium]